MSRDLEKTLVEAVNRAKAAQELKLFKQFVACKDDKERAEIGAKMNVLTDVVRALSREIKKID